MSKLLHKLRVSTKLLLLAGVLLTGLIVYGACSLLILGQIRIQGPYYEKIIKGNELIADILPPPAYIIELYLLAFQQLDETDGRVLEAETQKGITLNRNFEERQRFWRNYLPSGDLKETFTVNSYRFGREFFEIWRNKFVPLVENGKRDEARAVLLGPLKDLYAEHRRYIDETVSLAKTSNANLETEVNAIYTSGMVFSVGMWIAMIVLGLLMSYLISHSINEHLHHIARAIATISSEIASKMSIQAQIVSQESSSVHETTSAMDELNTSFEHTQILAQDSSNKAKNALRVSEDGNQLLKQMIEGLFGHKEKVLAIVEQIRHLSEIIAQIHQIASVTSNLTNQTNILALNAAVQAANVKQHSEGFTVIASEIRKLADESKRFLAQIDVLAENIQHAIDTTQSIVEEGSRTVQDNIKLAQSSLKAFDSIIDISTSSFEGTEQVCLNVKQQGSAVHQVLQAMEIITQTATDTLSGLNKVEEATKQLNTLCAELEEIV